MCSCRERTAAQDLAAHREGGQLHRPSLPPGLAMIALTRYLPAAPKSSAIITYLSQATLLLLPEGGSKSYSFERQKKTIDFQSLHL